MNLGGCHLTRGLAGDMGMGGHGGFAGELALDLGLRVVKKQVAGFPSTARTQRVHSERRQPVLGKATWTQGSEGSDDVGLRALLPCRCSTRWDLVIEEVTTSENNDDGDGLKGAVACVQSDLGALLQTLGRV
jgi:hypothetical protein